MLDPLDSVLAITLAPLLETFLFTFALHALDRVWRAHREVPLIMAALMVLVGWTIHGADLLSVNRALPFGLLGYLYLQRTRRSGEPTGFAVTAQAHSIWNALILGAGIVKSM